MTTNLNYKFLKLTNGDDIVCTTENDCSKLREQKTISIIDPVLISAVRMPRGASIVEGYVLHPWVSFVDATVFEIPVDSIIIATEVQEKLKTAYVDFLIREKQTISIDGTEDSVENKIMENLLSILKDEDNAEEKTTVRTIRNRRKLH